MKILKFLFPLVVLNLIALIFVTFGLPDMVPVHMNLVGMIEGFGSKWYIPIMGVIPLFIVIAYILYIYWKNSDLNKSIEEKIISAIVLCFIAISWIPILIAFLTANLNIYNSSDLVSIEILSLVLIVLSALFIFIGSFMEDIKPNYFFGIRTPWTLKNELVWKKTHKLGSYTSMISGFILLVYGLATFISGSGIYFIIGLFIAIFLLAVVPIVYSYYEFNKIIK